MSTINVNAIKDGFYKQLQNSDEVKILGSQNLSSNTSNQQEYLRMLTTLRTYVPFLFVVSSRQRSPL